MLILLDSPEVLSRKLHLGGKKKEFEEFKELQEFKEAEPWSAASLARPKRSAPWSAPRFRLLEAYGAIRLPPDEADRTLPQTVAADVRASTDH